jgi:hypothetical protein
MPPKEKMPREVIFLRTMIFSDINLMTKNVPIKERVKTGNLKIEK